MSPGYMQFHAPLFVTFLYCFLYSAVTNYHKLSSLKWHKYIIIIFFLNGSDVLLAIFFFFFNLFYLWLCWVFISVRGLSPVVASRGHSSSRCTGLSLSRPLLLRSTGSRCAGSAIVAHGPSRSAACGIFPDQGSNPCPLHWQADSQPLRHQGSPTNILLDRCLGKRYSMQMEIKGKLE